MKPISEEFMVTYNRCLERLKKDPRGYKVAATTVCDDTGVHPADYRDYECSFAAYHIQRLQPDTILDIGSHRFFLLGLMSHYSVTTIDVRDRRPALGNEKVVTCDAKQLNLPDNQFDVVLSLCALEHFGLGRYGDEYDLDADKKAVNEMIRVLKPGGRLIFTTTITNGPPTIDFNAHRIYSYSILKELCAPLEVEEERFYSHRLGDFCSLDQVTYQENVWDVYLGCWRKNKSKIARR